MSDIPATPLPPVPACKVMARFANLDADGTDEDQRPDWSFRKDQVLTLVPSIGNKTLVYDPFGQKILVTVRNVQAVTNEDGWLVHKDTGLPVLLPSTDNELMSTQGWTWTTSVNGANIRFPAPSDGVVNLADYIFAPAVDTTFDLISRIPELIALIEAGTDPATIGAAVEDYLADNPMDPGGLKVYTSWAEVDAESESVMGVLTTDDWAPAGLTYGSKPRDGAFFITTQVQTVAPGSSGAGVWRRQELRMGDGALFKSIWRVRQTFEAGGPWWEWWDVTHWDLPDALKSSLAKAGDAVVELNAADFNNPKAPYVVGHYNTNWRTLTGFAVLPNNAIVAHVFHGGALTGYSTGNNWTQTVVVALADGTPRTITRVSTNGTSYGAWTLQPTIPDSPDDIGAAPATHDHTAADIDSGAALDGHVLTADGAGGAAWLPGAPDTGARDVIALMSNGDAHYLNWGPQYHIRRIGPVVYFNLMLFLKVPDPPTTYAIYPGGNGPTVSPIPVGFRPSGQLAVHGLYHYAEIAPDGKLAVRRLPAHTALMQPWEDGQELMCSGSWTTLDPMPADEDLPGVAVS